MQRYGRYISQALLRNAEVVKPVMPVPVVLSSFILLLYSRLSLGKRELLIIDYFRIHLLDFRAVKKSAFIIRPQIIHNHLSILIRAQSYIVFSLIISTLSCSFSRPSIHSSIFSFPVVISYWRMRIIII